MRSNQQRSFKGYNQPLKLAKHSQDEDEQQPELKQDQILVMEQQVQFTAQYLYQTFKQLSEAIETNGSQRVKYATQPEKFYDSEAVLNDMVSQLSSISAYPDLVPDFIKSNLMKLLIELLDHPNEAILGQTVEVIYEFLMMEIESQNISQRHLLYWKSMAGQYFLQKLLALLTKLNEDSPSEYETVYRILRITEELLTINPKLSDVMVDCSKIMQYLSDRILPNFIVQYRKIDDNKFISSQILVQLLQFSKQNRNTFHQFNGMQVLLECIIPYKDKQLPKDMELQFLVNVFDLVCIMNIQQQIKIVFQSMQGVQLMLHFVKLKNYLSKPALKCLASGLMRQSIKSFMNAGGIKYIFPILLHHGLKQKQKQQQMVIDQNTCIIILQLLKLTQGKDNQRVIYKFKQKNFQKLLRLVEMRVQYSDMIQEQIRILDQEQYLKKLGQGLRIIQIIDLLLLHIIVKNTELKNNIKEMFKYFQFQPRKVQNNLIQYLNHLHQENNEYLFIKEHIGMMFPFMIEDEGVKIQEKGQK